MTYPHAVDWQQLQRRIAGEVLLPSSPGWAAASRPHSPRFAAMRPSAVVACAQARDVSQVLSFIREHDLPLVIRSGGHDFAGRSSTTGVVVDTTSINHVRLDGTVATIGAGARLGKVYRELNMDGRAIPGGCGATVGIAGLALGGGLGVLGRHYGLTCDHLRAITITLADGRSVTCDDDHDSELFWALRGAGHAYFGIATELVFDTIAAPTCHVFDLEFAPHAAADVLAAWQTWAPDAPAEMAASLLLTTPPDPTGPLRVTVLGATHDLDADTTAILLEELIAEAGTAPTASWQQTAPWLEAKAELAQRAPGTPDGWDYSKSEFHDRALPTATVDTLVHALATDRTPGEARELDFSPWGGAYNAVPPDATAFPHRTARFLLKHTASLAPETALSQPAAGNAWLNRSWRAAHRASTGGVYPNFPDPDLPDSAQAYFQSNLDRLRHLKKLTDPHAFFPPLGH